MPGDIGATSEHRRDLTLTSRSRCYSATRLGYFRPGGGGGSNGSDRCTNAAHYYRSTLVPRWPKAAPAYADYVRWTLMKMATRFGVESRRVAKLRRDAAQHRLVCAQLAERPWLLAQASMMLEWRGHTNEVHERRLQFAAIGVGVGLE